MKDFGIALLVYYIYQQQQIAEIPVVDKSYGQCGASYAGTGISLPCELVGKGLDAAYNYVKDQTKPIVGEVKAAQGTGVTHIGLKEAAFFPVTVTYATVNEIKRIPGLGWL